MRATRTIPRPEQPDQAGRHDPTWREAYPLQVFRMPRCPRCSCVRVLRDRSIDQGDGSRFCYVHCGECRLSFKAVFE